MATFLAFAAVMIAAALSFVLVPLLRRPPAASTAADSARRLRMLDRALASGILEENEYATKRAMLEKKDTTTQSQPASGRRSRAAFAALLAVALLLPASALLLYRLVGTPQALDPANLAPPPGAEHSAADMENAIAGLAAKLKQNPDDAQGWALLARAYQATDRAAESRDAFKQAHERAPDDADIAVEYAQALAVASLDHRLDGEPRTLLENVLKKDPKNQRALWLIGISDYQSENYANAIATWKTLLPMLAPDSDVARSVRNEIADAEARRDGRAPPEPERAPAGATESADQSAGSPEGAVADAGGGPAPAQNADSGAAQTAATPRLTVSVTLDPKLKDKLDSSATLFVFARAASGPPMPLAIKRLKAGELPATVTLDDSMSMMPAMKLSKFAQVVVGARVSKSGNAMPQSGDLQALSPPIASSRSEPISLEIDQVVP
ncbi:MAG TPA: c-type cytochrome biogenesis protein CcmI [Rhodanobacteraceae bacterium]|jgi:cytochrome c-type biogenesis protein CcmH|nr:c-type cytochrome biogenesis protein CcmI [Rhodanobacteraceae bacterium]